MQLTGEGGTHSTNGDILTGVVVLFAPLLLNIWGGLVMVNHRCNDGQILE